MRWVAAVLVTLGIAHPAWSLSCLPKDVARDFAAASASDDSYLIVRGALFFDETQLPNRDNRLAKPPRSVEISAWLKGQSLTPDGFTNPFERDVTIRVTCLAQWCGAIENGDHLTFLKKEGQAFVVEASPCGSFVYPNPTETVLDTAKSCMRGDSCEPQSHID